MTLTAQDRWLVALDVDGTIVHEDDSLAPRVADAVRAVEAAGHDVVIATGRSQPGTESIVDRVGIEPRFLVCANGALILQATDRGFEPLHVETFDATAVLERIRLGLPDATYMVEDAAGQRRFTHGMDDWNLEHALEVPFDRLAEQEVMRVVVRSPDHSADDFLEVVEQLGLHKVTYAIGFSSWLDIAPEGVHKATGLALVAAELGADRQRIVAVGDGRNDIDMLEWVAAGGGTAVAMGQAPAEVLAAATETTAPVDDDGLADVLERLLVSVRTPQP